MISNREKAECAAREVTMRKRVYPRWVADGKMKQSAADRQIEIMDAIAADYGALAEADEAKERLL